MLLYPAGAGRICRVPARPPRRPVRTPFAGGAVKSSSAPRATWVRASAGRRPCCSATTTRCSGSSPGADRGRLPPCPSRADAAGRLVGRPGRHDGGDRAAGDPRVDPRCRAPTAAAARQARLDRQAGRLAPHVRRRWPARQRVTGWAAIHRTRGRPAVAERPAVFRSDSDRPCPVVTTCDHPFVCPDLGLHRAAQVSMVAREHHPDLRRDEPDSARCNGQTASAAVII
jgi:hypothetical protein